MNMRKEESDMQIKAFTNKLVMIFYLTLLSITLGGCRADSRYTETMGQEAATTSETIEEQVKCIGQDEMIELETYDYDSFLGKVWVCDSWGGDTCDYGGVFSFRLLTLNEKIEAEYTIGGVKCPTYYSSAMASYMMQGEKKNDTWECDFENKFYSGKVSMTIKRKDCIEMEIQYVDKPSWDEGVSDGIYQFRPYNLIDISDLEKNENLMETISTLYGENLYLMPVQIAREEGTCPDAFIVDENDNIYFRFEYNPLGLLISNVIVEDINQDGLDDVNLVMKESATTDEKLIAKVFLQDKNGTFIKYPVAYCAYSEGKTYDADEDLSYCDTLIIELTTALENGTIETFLTQRNCEPELLEQSELISYIGNELDEHRIRAFYQSSLYEGENIEEKNAYLVKQDDTHFDIVIQEKRGTEYLYYIFSCEGKEGEAFLTEIGMETVADTTEHYFLECNGKKYLCIPKRHEDGNIVQVVLHTFENKILSDRANIYEDEYDYYGSAIVLSNQDELTIIRYDYIDGGMSIYK